MLSEIRLRFKYLKHKIKKTPRYLLTKRVENFLRNASAAEILISETEKEQFLKFLRCRLIETFNYPFMTKYCYRRIKVHFDLETGLRYVLTDENRKLYFKRSMSVGKIRRVYNSLCCEQDVQSPHNYCFNDLSINSGSVFVDAGAAEGILTLKFIDKIKTAYLFECDNDWIEALQATFRPWKEKVVIVNKYVSDKDNEEFTSLDNFFLNREKPTLIKIDVEGAESEALKGANKLLDKGIDDILVCSYHRNGDEQNLSRQLQEKGYKTTHSHGYMLFIYEFPNYALEAPFNFRRGLIHASKPS
jgi:hypothetical protein